MRRELAWFMVGVSLVLTLLCVYAQSHQGYRKIYGNGVLGEVVASYKIDNETFILTVNETTFGPFNVTCKANLTGTVYAYTEVFGVDIPLVSESGFKHYLAKYYYQPPVLAIMKGEVKEPQREPKVYWGTPLVAWAVTAALLYRAYHPISHRSGVDQKRKEGGEGK